MASENLEKKLDELGAKRAATARKIRALDSDHKAAYQAAASDPAAAGEKLQGIRREIAHHRDLIAGIDAAMKELGGQVVDQRLKNYPALRDQINKDLSSHYFEAGRNFARGMAYLRSVGAAPPPGIMASLTMQYPEISAGVAAAGAELEQDPIPNIVSRKHEVEQIRQQLSGAGSRDYLIEKIIGPAIRAHR